MDIKEAQDTERVERILEIITEDFVEMIANFYMTEDNRKRTYELWQNIKRQILKKEKE